jgi:predicted HAD superfamily Cof-like phosphohydrolase
MLFGAHVRNTFSMTEDQTQDIPQISNKENIILTADFSVEEVHEAIAQMEHNKALGSDGFP